MRIRLIVLLIVLCLSLPAMAQDTTTLTLITHDSFNISEDVLAAFEANTGITVEILRSGDSGQMVNQSILSQDNPLGDVLFGVDNTFLSRALDADLFLAYESPLLENVPEALQIDPEFRVTPIDFGDVCLNYDINYFEQNNLELPDSLEALTEPAYKGLLVAENPATSSPGLAFLLATIAQFGEEGDYTYLDYWADLVANEVLIADGWEDAYFGSFTAVTEDGTHPLVVSYASSPPVTIDPETEIATTASLVADGMCFRQIEFVGILAGTEKVEAAQQLIDFMLDVEFQEDVPMQMYVFPANELAQLPEDFVNWAQIPENPAYMDVETIDAQREEWLQAWTEVVLR